MMLWRKRAPYLRHDAKDTLGRVGESVSSPCATKCRSFGERDPPGDKQRHDMMMMDGRSDFKPCRDEATF